MSKERKVVYEPHPVSPERKDELREAGYKIIDARFAPVGYKHPGAEEKAQRPARPVKPGAEQKAD